MKKSVLMLLAVLSVCVISVNAGTAAYWRFEDGTAGAPVTHGGAANGVFYQGVVDVSGNDNGLSVFAEGWAGYVYSDSVAYTSVPLNGFTNNYSVKNSGGYPAMSTETGSSLSTMSPSAFTIEATFKLENGGYRTIVGRDSRGSNTQANQGVGANGDLAALYFQAMPGNSVAIKFCDAAGYWHEAVSAENVIETFDWSSNPNGDNVPWYSMAAVSDGSTLSLYLNKIGTGNWQLLAQTDMTLSGSTNTALTVGAGDGGDWDAGNWSVGRGLYAGNHGDRAYGFIDEVRISDSALAVSQFLVPEPATMMLLGLGSLLTICKRK